MYLIMDATVSHTILEHNELATLLLFILVFTAQMIE